MDQAAHSSRNLKWPTAAALLALVVTMVLDGVDLEPLARTIAACAWFACWTIALLRAPARLRSYVALAGVSATVGLLLLLFRGEAQWLAALFWGISTLLGLIWCVFYERSGRQRR